MFLILFLLLPKPAVLSDLYNKGYIKLIPSEKLEGNTKYTLVVTKNVKDSKGNLFQQEPDKVPADFKLDLFTQNDAAPKLVGTP